MKSPQTQTELLKLFSRVCDQVASEQEFAWLNKAMQSDPRVRYLYWEFISAEVEIRSWAKQPEGAFEAEALTKVDLEKAFAEKQVSDSSHEPASIFSIATDTIHWRRHPVRFVFSIAMLAASMWGIGLGFQTAWDLGVNGQPGFARQAPHQQRMATAKIVSNINAEWADGATAFTEQTELKQDQVLRLTSGLSVVEFASGARVVLRGPSTFVISGYDKGYLEAGELTARLNPESSGFEVLTPKATIVDLGTQFGVRVPADGQGDGVVQVFDGSVEMFSEQSDIPTRIIAGKASSLTGRGIGLPKVGDFVREQLLPVLSGDDDETSIFTAQSDGSFDLPTSKAKLTARELFFLPSLDALVQWRDRNDFPSWEVSLDEDTEFDVTLDFSCINEDSDGEFVFMVDGSLVGEKHLAENTGGWLTFKQIKYGTIEIKKGRHAVSVISQKKKRTGRGLMNLRGIKLVGTK